ncbi:DUF4397 domain-containing protein [Chitinophaga nivalis]|nr:DUF4397 domain-containing protein [Chitinophaga nivalis]MCW3467671.1 DUF4397 domain-containing protein [Chitinophaga nivalis]
MKQWILPVLVILGLLAACKKDSDSSIPVTASHIMFFNGVPGTATFSVLLDTLEAASEVSYGKSTSYKSFRAQKYNLYIYDTRNPERKMYVQQINLRNGRYYSVFLGVDSIGKTLTLRAVEDDLNPALADSSKFRVVNLSEAFRPNRQPLVMDIWSGKNNRFFRGLGYTDISPYATVYADSTYDINFRWIDSSLVFKQMPLRAQKGKIYTLVTTGHVLTAEKFQVFQVTHN